MRNFLFLILFLPGLFSGSQREVDLTSENAEREFSLHKDANFLYAQPFFESSQTEFSDEGSHPGSCISKGNFSNKVFNFRDPEKYLGFYLVKSKFIEPGLSLPQIIFPFHSIF